MFEFPVLCLIQIVFLLRNVTFFLWPVQVTEVEWRCLVRDQSCGVGDTVVSKPLASANGLHSACLEMQMLCIVIYASLTTNLGQTSGDLNVRQVLRKIIPRLSCRSDTGHGTSLKSRTFLR